MFPNAFAPVLANPSAPTSATSPKSFPKDDLIAPPIIPSTPPRSFAAVAPVPTIFDPLPASLRTFTAADPACLALPPYLRVRAPTAPDLAKVPTVLITLGAAAIS